MNLRRPTTLLFCGLCILMFIGTYVTIPRLWPESHSFSIQEKIRQREDRVCVQPELKVDDPIMQKGLLKYKSPICEGEKDWIYVSNGTVKFSDDALGKIMVKCQYFPLIRDNDYKYHWDMPGFNITDGFPITSDFFMVNCTNQTGGNYKGIHAGVAYNKQRANRPEPPLRFGFDGLGIAILGFDSMSRMSWLRRLPKTRKYFHEELGAIELEGHNIVGDGTTAVLLPMLTGKFEWELPECRYNKKGAVYLDDFPFIWHDLKRAGYLTSFNEDKIGSFNYRMKGFKNQPTDYYTRPFYLAVRDVLKKNNYTQYCLGSQTQSQIWLNHFKDIFMMYKDKRKFILHFLTGMSHDDNNPITMMDEDIADLLKFLYDKNYLNNTVLILLGDHGMRFGDERKTWEGKLEERRPYVAFLFPEWFERKYPGAIRNLRSNSKGLTTPFDVYETFQDFLHFDGDGVGNMTKRGISLFKEIPFERSCDMADIAPHWCTCLEWEDADPQKDETVEAVETAITAINNLTADYRDDCALFSVRSVTSAKKLEAKKDLLAFRDTDVEGGIYDINLTGNTKRKVTYQVTFVTEPGAASFEVTVTFDRVKRKFLVNEKEISRINQYGNDPYCILDKFNHIKPYCYCKDLIIIDNAFE